MAERVGAVLHGVTARMLAETSVVWGTPTSEGFMISYVRRSSASRLMMPASCAKACVRRCFVGLPVLAGERQRSWLVGRALGPDAVGKRQTIRSNSHPHDDLFERGVAGPLADAVNRALDLPDAGRHRSVRVRHSQAEIVVAVTLKTALSEFGTLA